MSCFGLQVGFLHEMNTNSHTITCAHTHTFPPQIPPATYSLMYFFKISISVETQDPTWHAELCFQGGGLIPRCSGTPPKTGALFLLKNIPMPLWTPSYSINFLPAPTWIFAAIIIKKVSKRFEREWLGMLWQFTILWQFCVAHHCSTSQLKERGSRPIWRDCQLLLASSINPALHSAAKCHSVCLRLQVEEASRTTSSAKAKIQTWGNQIRRLHSLVATTDSVHEITSMALAKPSVWNFSSATTYSSKCNFILR